jgi:hypothetical protein
MRRRPTTPAASYVNFMHVCPLCGSLSQHSFRSIACKLPIQPYG